MIRYTEEPLSHCQADVESLLPEQWAETGDFGIECKPNWPFYYTLEGKKALLLLMARNDHGAAIGYLAGYILPHPNSVGQTVATLATYFVRQCPGRALLLRSLLAHGSRLAWERGVWKVNIETEYSHSYGSVLEMMGFRPHAVRYTMTRKDEERAHA